MTATRSYEVAKRDNNQGSKVSDLSWGKRVSPYPYFCSVSARCYRDIRILSSVKICHSHFDHDVFMRFCRQLSRDSVVDTNTL